LANRLIESKASLAKGRLEFEAALREIKECRSEWPAGSRIYSEFELGITHNLEMIKIASEVNDILLQEGRMDKVRELFPRNQHHGAEADVHLRSAIGLLREATGIAIWG
jgi:hypothetical protein